MNPLIHNILHETLYNNNNSTYNIEHIQQYNRLVTCSIYKTAIGTWEYGCVFFCYEERLTYAFDIKGIFKLETILKYLDLNVLIENRVW